MKLAYLLAALVFLSCSCEQKFVDAIAVLNANETIDEAPHILFQPRILITKKDSDANATDDSIPRPIITSMKLTNAGSDVEKNLNLCARTRCPFIYCQNRLPAIPSQGVCCQRCVTNPKCNASACPKYKCGTYLIPANFTVGECCDRCAPATGVSTTASTYAPVETQATSSKPEETRQSSSEENNRKTCQCNLRPLLRKQRKSQLRLVRLLTKTLSHFRHHHGHRRYDHSTESEEN